MLGPVLAIAAFTLIAIAIGLWVRLIARVEIDEGRRLPSMMVVSAFVLGLIALSQSPGLFGGILAGATVAVAAVAFLLQALASQSGQSPAFAVGDALPSFSALDDRGEPFDLARLNGRPILMKFFRGHW
jgi:cytochrome oxidase Cu insertion factor (SCO1/SenC/PrrC family)